MYMDRWMGQFWVLMGVSCIVAACALLLPSRGSRIVLFVIHGLMCLIAVYPLGTDSISALPVFVSLLVQAHLLFSVWRASIASALFAVTAILIPTPVSAWGEAVTLGMTARSASFVVLVAMVGVGLFALHKAIAALASAEQTIWRLNDSVLRLTSANVDFQNHAMRAGRRSSEEERNRITREVHDTIGHSLTNVKMMMEAAQDLVGQDHSTLRRFLLLSQDQAQNALEETRRILRALRAFDDPPLGGVRALHRLFSTFQEITNVSISVVYGNLPMVTDPATDTIIYRTVQEGLANSFRHGRATEVTVIFWYDGHEVNLNIRDNGIGSDSVEEGIGLQGMKERIEPLSGTVTAGNLPEGGFELRVRIPITHD